MKISEDIYLFGSIATAFTGIIIIIILAFISYDNLLILFFLSLLLLYFIYLCYYLIKAKEVYLDFNSNCFLIKDSEEKVSIKKFSDFISFKITGRGFIKLTFRNKENFFFFCKKDSLVKNYSLTKKCSKSVIKNLNEIIENNKEKQVV